MTVGHRHLELSGDLGDRHLLTHDAPTDREPVS
jgi:hypothetical protein